MLTVMTIDVIDLPLVLSLASTPILPLLPPSTPVPPHSQAEISAQSDETVPSVTIERSQSHEHVFHQYPYPIPYHPLDTFLT